jgi:hypothetical protein
MKKFLTYVSVLSAIGTGGLTAFEMPVFSLDSQISYESEYVTHGRKEGQGNVQIAAEVGADVAGGYFYAGASSVLVLRDSVSPYWYHTNTSNAAAGIEYDALVSKAIKSYNSADDSEDITTLGNTKTAYTADDMKKINGEIENLLKEGKIFYAPRTWSMTHVSPYVGYCYDFPGLITADVGIVTHIYSNLKNYSLNNSGDVKRNTTEIYGGVLIDVIGNPKAYMFYDIDREEFTLVASGSYSYDLTQFGFPHLALEGKAEAGYDYAKRPFGIKDFFANPSPYGEQSKGYLFFKLGGEISYRYSENVSMCGGFYYSGNGSSDGHWSNIVFGGGHKNLTWFGCSIKSSF